MGHDALRAALVSSFSVDALNEIARVGHDLLDSDTVLRHPIAVYAVAATAQKVAWYWEGHAVREETAAAIEAHINGSRDRGCGRRRRRVGGCA